MANTNDLKKCHYVEDENIWITPKGRMSFVALARKFRGKDAKPDDDGKYAVEISFAPDRDIKPLKKAANDAAQEKFGNKIDLWVPGKAKGIKNGFLKADEKLSDITSKGEPVDLDGFTMIRTTAYKRRPVVRLPDGSVCDIDDIETEAYPGRWARIMVRPSGYDVDNGKSKGVTWYLEGVQLLAHDDNTGTQAPATTGEAFGAVDDDDEDGDAGSALD